MDEQQIHEWIKAVFADQPAKCLDSLILALVWPDDLASQDLIVDILIRKAAQKRDRWRESEAAQQFLQGKAREAEYAMRFEGARPENFSPNLIAWALSIAGHDGEPRKYGPGRPQTEALRNIVILALVDAIKAETGCTEDNALNYIARARKDPEDTIRSRMKQARIDRKTRVGNFIYNGVEIMVYEAWEAHR